jgi:phenylpropionate dioxygenase-like ring-hydroxylating dioxygenase large terminal subunit
MADDDLPSHPAAPALAPRKSVVRVPQSWYALCFTSELNAGKLRPATLLGTPLVLWRDQAGVAQAVADRCPHRNVPLSAGSVVGGELQCRYHGWRFGSGGRCTAIPGLPIVDGDAVDGPGRCATSFAAHEADGVVWVWGQPGVVPATAVPPSSPQLSDPRFRHVRHRARIRAPLHAVLENILDVPHTSFLHGGWFRSAKKTQRIDVEVERRTDGVTAQFFGEQRPPGVIAWMLSPSGGTIEHWDRFRLPSIAEVEYRLGPENQIIATTLCSPVDDECTDLLSIVSVRTRLPPGPLLWLVYPVALRILAQDREILEAQTDTIAKFGGERMSSTAIDLLGPHVLHLLKRAEQDKLSDAVVRTERSQLWV